MVGLVFGIAYLSFGVNLAITLSLRLFNLFTVSWIFFAAMGPDEIGAALQKLGIPYTFVFILTTAMHYVPLIGQKIRRIMDAQQSRGIDLTLKLKNIKNFMALLIPLLVQSFLLSDELAIAMELRGFGQTRRSIRKQYHFTLTDYACLTASMVVLAALMWWDAR
jgi:energy-coupling factor transport system permease protein